MEICRQCATLSTRPRGLCKIVGVTRSHVWPSLGVEAHCLQVGQFVTIFSFLTSTRAAAGVFLIVVLNKILTQRSIDWNYVQNDGEKIILQYVYS